MCHCSKQFLSNCVSDYLTSLNEEQQAVITGDSKFLEGSGDEPDHVPEIKFNMPIRTGKRPSAKYTSLNQLQFSSVRFLNFNRYLAIKIQ